MSRETVGRETGIVAAGQAGIIPSATAQQAFENLNDIEQDMIVSGEVPIEDFLLMGAINYAVRKELEQDPDLGPPGTVDVSGGYPNALLHCMSACASTKIVGTGRTRKILNAHEAGDKVQSAAEADKDYHNNNAGVACGKNARSIADCGKCCKKSKLKINIAPAQKGNNGGPTPK
ncbi:MAG: hypothetical protein ACKVWV_17785 [Planctomycetota bacterium]